MFVRGLCSNFDILFQSDVREALDKPPAAVSPKGSAKNSWDFRVWFASPSSGRLVYKEETFVPLSRFERPGGNGCLFVF